MSTGSKRVGRFYLDMHPREGKDKWFSAAPVVTGVRGRYLPEAALICNFPGEQDDPAPETPMAPIPATRACSSTTTWSPFSTNSDI